MNRPVAAQVGVTFTAADVPWELSPPPDVPLNDLLTDALIAVDAYRLLAQVALHAQHDLVLEHDRLQARYAQVLDDNRTLRAQLRGEEV